jgi:hypothetical protein
MPVIPSGPSLRGAVPAAQTRRTPALAVRGPAAVELNRDATDFDVLEDEELEWPGTREEFERWLDSIAPTEEELEHRARCDAFLGEIA